MKKIPNKYLFILKIFLVLVAVQLIGLCNVSITRAATPPITTLATTGGANSAAPDSFGSTLQDYISNFYTWAIGIAGLLAIIMLIYAGYEYVTSSGNPEQVNQAKDIIIGAVAALVLLLLASLFLKTLGVSL